MFKSQHSDLNREPTAYRAVALPLSYAGMCTLKTTYSARRKPFTSCALSIAILCLSQSHRIKRDKVFCGWLCDSSNPPFGRNSLCSGFTIYAKHISVNWCAGRTFIIRSRISSPLLTFTYRDFKLRLLSRLRISHNTQRPCYDFITVFDFCGTNWIGWDLHPTWASSLNWITGTLILQYLTARVTWFHSEPQPTI